MKNIEHFICQTLGSLFKANIIYKRYKNMKLENNNPTRIVRMKETTYQKLRRFGHTGEPFDSAVNNCIELASQKIMTEKQRQSIASEITP